VTKVLDPLEPRDVDPVATIEASLRGWLPVFERLPGGRLDHVAGCARWLCDVPLPLFNGVIGMPGGDHLDTSIAAVLEPFDAAAIPLLWVVPAHEGAIIRALGARGFAVEFGTPTMTIDLAKLPPLEAPAGTTIDEVDADPEALRDAAMIALTSNGMPPWSVGPYLEALERVPDRETIRTFLARRDGAPLAASTLVSAGGVAGLYNVGTLPDARRTGLGGLVSTAAMTAGRDAGYRVGVLQSSDLGRPVYQAMGFQECATFTFAVRFPPTGA